MGCHCRDVPVFSSLLFLMISPPACRYVSKTATSTRLDFDYDGPSMKTTVPGPRSQVTHTHTHTYRQRSSTGPRHNIFTNVLIFLCMQDLLKQLGDIQVSFFLYLSVTVTFICLSVNLYSRKANVLVMCINLS